VNDSRIICADEKQEMPDNDVFGDEFAMFCPFCRSSPFNVSALRGYVAN